MAKTMKVISAIALLLTICCFALYKITTYKVLFPFMITAGTIAYHFMIRLLVGAVIDSIMHNKANYHKKWYHVGELEMKLYQKLKVKKWKNKMPTFRADVFDISKHSWDEICQATCQSELVHETDVIFSFLPVIASIWVGSFWVFFITSVFGAVFDLMFVMMQRFNRTRILKMKETDNTKLSGCGRGSIP